MTQPSSRLRCRWLMVRSIFGVASLRSFVHALLPGLLSLFLVVTAYHASSEAAGSSLPTRKPPPEAAHLESVLYQLTQADDVAVFARQRAIDLIEGRVRVIVELNEGSVLDMGAGAVIESRYRNLVRVLVPIDQLLPLSQRKGVRFVRLPQKPVANNE